MSSLPPVTKANAGVRFGARIIDGFVLVIPILIVSTRVSTNGASSSFSIGTNSDALGTTIGVLIAYGYFVIAEATKGTTVGKSVFDIDIRAADGKPTFAQAAKRNSFMLLSIVPGTFGGLLTFAAFFALVVSISVDRNGQGIHDHFADVVLDRH